MVLVASSLAVARTSLAQIAPSIEFRVPEPPTVANSDAGAFLSYELHVTNLTANPMTLKRVEVLDAAPGGSVVADLADSALARALARPGINMPAAERAQIGPGLRAYVYLWIPVNASRPPASLRHQLTFQGAGDSTLTVLEGTVIPVGRSAVVISPPVYGEWAAFNGPSNTSGHRRLILALEGHIAIGQRFAIDFLQVDSSGSSHRPGADPLKNSSYYAYGTELHAVADGVIAGTKDSIPENVPGANSRAVTITMQTVGGNYVAIEIGGGLYAYAHVQPGSLRVRVGDHVRRGQVVALLGNSGNSTEPHVHFQVADGPTFLSSEGVPYAIEHFDVIGHCGISSGPPPAITCTRTTPVPVERGIPLQNELVRFGRAVESR